MSRRKVRVLPGRRRRVYHTSALWRHRSRVRWLLAQRTRLRNQGRFTEAENGQ